MKLLHRYQEYYSSLYGTLTFTEDKIYCDEGSLPLESPDFEYPKYEPSVKLKPFSSVLYLVCDIETTGLDPYVDDIKAIGVRGNGLVDNPLDSTSIKLIGNDERQLLIDFCQLLRQTNFKILSFHNGFIFDIPFLYTKLVKHNLQNLFTKGGKVKITSGSINGKPIEYDEYYYPGKYILDTMHLAAIWDRTFSKLSSYGLKSVPYELGLIKESRTDLSYKEILKCYENSDPYYNYETLLSYLDDDLESTELLFKFFVPSIYYQLLLVPDVDLQRISRSSPALKAQKIYDSLCGTKYGEVNTDPTMKYEGALSQALGIGAFKNCFKLDVSSLYPSIMLNWGLCSIKDEDRKFLGFLSFATEERLKYKRQLKDHKKGSLKYNEIDAIQNAFKVLINGSYGFLGTSGYGFNSFNTAALVTGYGRKILKIMMSVMDEYGIKIINIDTDGIVASIVNDVQDHQELISKVINDIHYKLPEAIRVELEFSDTNVFSPKAKNYIIFYSQDEYDAKGIFKKRNIEKFVAAFYLKYLQYYFYESEIKADKYYLVYKHLLTQGKLKVKDFTITRTISKAEKKIPAMGIANPGDKITYYLTFVERLHKRTGKFLGYNEVPVRIDDRDDFSNILEMTIEELNSYGLGEFFTNYYVDKLEAIHAELQVSFRQDEIISDLLDN